MVWLVLGRALPAWAGPTGSVVGFGWNNAMRGNAWVMARTTIDPGDLPSGRYQLLVSQTDMDGDTVDYVTPVTLTSGRIQESVGYFMPRSGRNPQGFAGLVTTSGGGGAALADLNRLLKVYLCTAGGQTICVLPVTAPPQILEAPGRVNRGQRLVVVVRSGGGPLPSGDYAGAIGIHEESQWVGVTPESMPTDLRPYDGVDAVVWANGGPPDRSQPGGEATYQALMKYVEGGGRLIVLQSAQWQLTASWGDVLPVRLVQNKRGDALLPRGDSKPLADIGKSISRNGRDDPQRFSNLPPGQLVALAVPLPNALIEQWVTWAGIDDVPQRTAWLARRPWGSGVVTYVAQDLLDRRLIESQANGWSTVWNQIFDLREDPTQLTKDADNDFAKVLEPSTGGYDLGQPVVAAMEMPGRVAGLLVIVLGFFIAYWLVAGPGLYLLLRQRDKLEWSWFGFGVVAGVATLFTLGVAQLILRGHAEMSQFSVVKIAADGSTTVHSRIGLYVPRDGRQRIDLPGAQGDVSWVTPFVEPLIYQRNREFHGARDRYTVATISPAGGSPEVIVPYRSTLKRFSMEWRGRLESRISGQPAIAPLGRPGAPTLSGILSNNSGENLLNVYLVWKSADNTSDEIVYLPGWPAGQSIRLELVTNHDKDSLTKLIDSGTGDVPGNGNRALQGRLMSIDKQQGWEQWFFSRARGTLTSIGDVGASDWSDQAPQSLPMLSIFDRLPVMRFKPSSSNRSTRVDLLRREGRFADGSAVVAAGQLLVVAETRDRPLPVKMLVNGNEMKGNGRVLWEWALPLDRSASLNNDRQSVDTAAPLPANTTPAPEP